MTEYSKFNMVYRLQKWLDSVPGQTFLNYAYSWGASVVILGTLFKLTHLPGANLMLYIGMGTEVVVFFISAFDRPFDKTADGKELPTHVTEEHLAGDRPVAEPLADDETTTTATGGAGTGGGTIIIGGGGGPGFAGMSEEGGAGTAAATGEVTAGTGQPTIVTAMGGIPFGGQQPQVTPEMEEAAREMEEATNNYVEELRNLTEMLAKVSEQSQRLTRDSEEMENLNRTLTGICKVYEMQLKGASAQIGTIDQINEQSRKMADQIAELNAIYSRMIEAMTINMKGSAPLHG